MRVTLLLLFLIVLAGCQSVRPIQTPAAIPVAPTRPVVPAGTVMPPGSLPPTGPSSIAPLESPVTPLPAATLDAFAASLRPEFRADLFSLDSPTTYRMNLALAPGLDRIGGSESIVYTNRTGGSLAEIYLRLFANIEASAGDIQVSNLRADGAPAKTILEANSTALRVQLGAPLAARQSIQLDLDFTAAIPISNTGHYADLTRSQDIVTLPTIYPLVPAHDAAGWHIEVPPDYGDLVYADSSLYDVTITAPTTTTVIASGVAVDRKESGPNTVWHYIGAPMRDFDITASPALQKASKTYDGVIVNSYYLPADAADGKQVLDWAGKAVGVYQKRVGAYPFTELDVVETPTTAGGIEYPGLVVISNKLYHDPEQSRALEFAVVHEVAHQWFYSLVGDDQVNTPWMDEALVQMVALLYEQDVNGAQAADFIRQRVFQSGYDRAKQQNEDMPIGLAVSAYTDRQYGEIVYGKGPLFFDALREKIGDAKFNQFLSTYFQRYKYKNARPQDLLQVMTEVGGSEVEPLYDQWVLGR